MTPTATTRRGIGEVIAEAITRCDPPTQRGLAEALGMYPTTLSNVKAGQRKFTDEQLQKLAALIGEEPAALWTLQELEALSRRNPFARGLASLGGLLSAFIVSVLLVAASALNPSHASENSASKPVSALHIVAPFLQIALQAAGLIVRLADCLRELFRRKPGHAEQTAHLATGLV